MLEWEVGREGEECGNEEEGRRHRGGVLDWEVERREGRRKKG